MAVHNVYQKLFETSYNTRFIFKRFYKKNIVRVRFAPSPTGHLHLGGLRTALYNYLFARSQKGSFILRIEDTDQTRIIHDSVEKLHSDLIWAGIIPDEDPIRGGPFGPYTQSKRIDLYKEQVQTLLDNKTAYRCFCSHHRLKLLRNAAIEERQVPKYDNRCRNLSHEDVKMKLKRGEIFCIRFKLLPTPNPFKDMIYGNINYDAQNEGDPVIFKSDGFPTYHFANVVDDHFMEISHVLRGVEWQISTQKHLLLYKAFGWTPPEFGHLPLIMNADGTKLSKRQNDIKVEHYRKEGIFPLALVNYITAAGGGFDRDKGLSHCYSYQELINQFDVNKINVNSSKLNPDKLLEMNRQELHNLLENEKNYKFLVERVIQLIKQAFPNRESDQSLNLDPNHILATLKWARNRITKINDLVTPDMKFLWVKPTLNENFMDPKHIELIDTLSKMLENLDNDKFSKEFLKLYLKEFAANNNIAFSDLMKTLRGHLSGLKQGPSVAEMMDILGRDATLSRLKSRNKP